LRCALGEAGASGRVLLSTAESSMSRAVGLSTMTASQVLLNVYDLNSDANETLYQFGLGMYHSGVQIGGNEFTFASGSGIFSHDPRQAGGAKFRETLSMGTFQGTQRDLDRILDELRDTFQGSSYHVLTMNCNSFADAFVARLVDCRIPGWVNRMASIGAFFSCLLPQQLGNEAPVTQAPGRATVAFSGEGHRLLQESDPRTSGSGGQECAEDRRRKVREATLQRFNQGQSTST